MRAELERGVLAWSTVWRVGNDRDRDTLGTGNSLPIFFSARHFPTTEIAPNLPTRGRLFEGVTIYGKPL